MSSVPAHHSAQSVRRLMRGAPGISLALLLVLGAVWLTLRGAAPGSGSSSKGSGGVSATPVPIPALASGIPAVAYDARHGELLLLGDQRSPSATWLWSPQGWVRTTPSRSPPGRSGAAIAYDPVGQRLLLFGGRTPAGQLLDDTWSWDGTTWTQLNIPAMHPPGADFTSMAWDQARNDIVLVTMTVAANAGGETWIWDGARWSPGGARARIPLDRGFVMAFDAAAWTVLLLTHGEVASAPQTPSSTWSWDGAVWRQLTTAHSPLAGFSTGLALDPRLKLLILVTAPSDRASTAAETWSWDGTDWKRLHPPSQPPAPIAAISDGSGRLLAMSPSTYQAGSVLQVWAWAGTTWTRLA